MKCVITGHEEMIFVVSSDLNFILITLVTVYMFVYICKCSLSEQLWCCEHQIILILPEVFIDDLPSRF